MSDPHQERSSSGPTAAIGSEKRSSQRRQKAGSATKSTDHRLENRDLTFEKKSELSESKVVSFWDRLNPSQPDKGILARRRNSRAKAAAAFSPADPRRRV
jgi:hypothetical protein